MPLDTLSTDSDSSYTWESLLDQSDLLTIEQKAAEKVNKDIGKEREREKEDYDFGVNDLDWDQRSVASAFSIYLAIEESARVSLLDCSLDGRSLDGKSFDSESFDCGATKVTAETDFWSLSSDELDVTDITVRRTIECESSDESVVTEAYELDEEDTAESDYEVESFESEKPPTMLLYTLNTDQNQRSLWLPRFMNSTRKTWLKANTKCNHSYLKYLKPPTMLLFTVNVDKNR